MASKLRRHPISFALRQVVSLADIVEGVKLDHQVVHRALRAFHKCQAVMSRIDMKEICTHRSTNEVADAKAQHLRVEGECLVNVGNHQKHMSHPEGSCTEAGNVASGTKWLICHLRAPKRLQPVTGGISKRDQVPFAPLIG